MWNLTEFDTDGFCCQLIFTILRCFSFNTIWSVLALHRATKEPKTEGAEERREMEENQASLSDVSPAYTENDSHKEAWI